jgi:peptidoglycan/LPS O-acetylase OafA/YrhL
VGDHHIVSGNRLRFIDGLRGIAAVMVLLYHLMARTPANALFARGYLGVGIFFVLSGFVIASVIGAHRMSFGFLGRFALRRMVRLDIPYWLNIVTALALMAVAVRLGVPKDAVSFGQVAAHLLYLQDILGYGQISTAYWTLCFEVQFYLTLALLLWAAERLRLTQAAFLAGFMVLLGLSVLDNMNWLPNPSGIMFKYWWAFALGALCFWTLSGNVRARWLGVASGVALCTVFAVNGDWRLIAVATAALLFLAWRRDTMDRWLTDRVSQFLGRISYSLYLCHPVIGWSAQSLALRYVNPWAALAIGVGASVLSAWLTWRFIERPSIWLSHHVSLDARGTPALRHDRGPDSSPA